MPLLRYRTGDRGRWITGTCACGRDDPRLLLERSRRPRRFVRPSGSTINVVRFNKVFAALGMDRVRLSQPDAGSVTVSFSSQRTLGQAGRRLVEAAIRCAMGPQTEVVLEQVPSDQTAEDGGSEDRLTRHELAEPEGPSPETIAEWLAAVLRETSGIRFAALTGSCLDPTFTSRHSDYDLVLLVDETGSHRLWLPLARTLTDRFPRLSVNVDRLKDLSRRAPLAACRLRREQIPLIGQLNERNCPWPAAEDLRLQGLFWSQEAAAAVWQILTTLSDAPDDPIFEAWRAAKLALNSLRFRYLFAGERETSARWLLTRVRADARLDPRWALDFQETFEVAAEHRPPPASQRLVKERFFQMALDCIVETQRVLENAPVADRVSRGD